jgi:hypothetical protein
MEPGETARRAKKSLVPVRQSQEGCAHVCHWRTVPSLSPIRPPQAVAGPLPAAVPAALNLAMPGKRGIRPDVLGREATGSRLVAPLLYRAV